MALSLDDANESLKEAVIYFFQLENANELEIAPPNDLFSYSTSVSPSIPEVWTPEADDKLLYTSGMIDRAISAVVENVEKMKWELVTKAIHMGRTSGSLEDAYESRHKELAGEDQGADTTLSKVSPEPFRSIWNSTSPKYENRQTPSKESISRLSNSLTTSYVKVKKRSASSECSSPEPKRIKPETKKDPDFFSYSRSISSIPAYSASSSSSTLWNKPALTTSSHRRVRAFSPVYQEGSTSFTRRSFAELKAEARALGREAEVDFEKFERGREKLGEDKLKVYKFRNRFPAQAARIDKYTHFDLEHAVKKAGLHRYSKLVKSEMLEKYLAYLHDKYKHHGLGLDRELAESNKSEIETSHGW